MSNGEELQTFTVSASGHIINEKLLFEMLFKLPKGRFFAKGFVPHINETLVAHVALYSCKYPKTNQNNSKSITMKVCDDGSNKMDIFGWTTGGREQKLLSDTAFELGEESGIPYIVLEFHYKKTNLTNQKDNSSVTIYWSQNPTKYNTGFFPFVKDHDIIPPQRGHFPVDIFCKYTGNATLYPFGMYAHTHKLGRSVVGFWMSSNGKQIVEFGRVNPSWPGSLYSIKSKFTIQTGDYIIIRCVYDSTNRSVEATIKPEFNSVEMCAVYLTYSIERTRVKSKPYDDISCRDERPSLFDVQLPNNSLDYMPDKIPPNYFPSEFLRSSVIE